MSRAIALVVALLVLLGAAGAVWFYTGGAEQGPGAVVLREVEGEVTRTRDGAVEDGRNGMAVAADDTIQTGEAGSAVLSRGGEALVRLMQSTEVTVVDVDERLFEVELKSGNVLLRARPNAPAVRLRRGDQTLLATDAEGVASVEDGIFAFEAERGSVSVSGVDEVSRVDAGQRLVVDEDGHGAVHGDLDSLLLDVAWPDAPPTRPTVTLEGTTWPAAWVRVEGPEGEREVRAGIDGTFSVDVVLPEGTSEVRIRADGGRDRVAEVVRELTWRDDVPVIRGFEVGPAR